MFVRLWEDVSILFYLWSLALLVPFCELINCHKMREVYVIDVVFSIMSSTFKEGSNAGEMRNFLTGREKRGASYNPT